MECGKQYHTYIDGELERGEYVILGRTFTENHVIEHVHTFSDIVFFRERDINSFRLDSMRENPVRKRK